MATPRPSKHLQVYARRLYIGVPDFYMHPEWHDQITTRQEDLINLVWSRWQTGVKRVPGARAPDNPLEVWHIARVFIWHISLGGSADLCMREMETYTRTWNNGINVSYQLAHSLVTALYDMLRLDD